MDRPKPYRRFRTLLIANRGEIACRVIRTARAMGLRTIAVYSEADRGAMHVAEADEAVLLGPARARDSYLDIERVIDAARRSGAEAVHPGYGFLSENADFAQACADAGLVFVGPTAEMMVAMGSKSGSKVLMEKAGVPLVPGYHGEAQDDGDAGQGRRQDRLSGAGQGVGRWRRPRHAGRAFGGRARGRDRQCQARGQGCVRRRSHADREIRRSSAPYRGAGDWRQPRQSAVAVRARVHTATAASEGDRGSAVADPRSGAAGGRVRCRPQGRRGGQLCRRRHHRIRLQWQGRVLHRDEHPTAGRASRDRTDHRDRSGRMAIAGGVRRKIAADAAGHRLQRTRHRSPGIRGKSPEEFHAVGRPYQDLAHAQGRGWSAHRCRLPRGRYGLALLRCHARQGDRLGADASGRDRQARSRAAGDRRPRRRHQHSVPVGAGDPPRRARQCHRHRFHRARTEEPDEGSERSRRPRTLRGCCRHPR